MSSYTVFLKCIFILIIYSFFNYSWHIICILNTLVLTLNSWMFFLSLFSQLECGSKGVGKYFIFILNIKEEETSLRHYHLITGYISYSFLDKRTQNVKALFKGRSITMIARLIQAWWELIKSFFKSVIESLLYARIIRTVIRLIK